MESGELTSVGRDLELNAKLQAKLLACVASIHNVEKNGRNDHHKYDFAADPDVLRACREAMVANNVMVTPSVLECAKVSNNVAVKIAFEVCDTETGYTRTLVWAGEANDTQDKATNKAMTATVKYFLLKLFLIPTGADPDGESVPTEQPTKQPAKKAAPQKDAATKAPSNAKLLLEKLGATDKADDLRRVAEECDMKPNDLAEKALADPNVATWDALLDWAMQFTKEAA